MASATIKKTTQYQAPDGTFHATSKAAAQHVQDMAVADALSDFVNGVSIEDQGVVVDGEGGERDLSIHVRTGLQAFLFANREQILAALQPKVEIRQRAQRKKKAAANDANGGQA